MSPSPAPRRSAFWRRPDVDEDEPKAGPSGSSSSGDDSQEELLLPSDEEGDDEPEEEYENTWVMEGRITKHLYIKPPTLERDVRNDPVLLLLQALTLLDSLETTPATKLKSNLQKSKGKCKTVDIDEASWADLDRLLPTFYVEKHSDYRGVPSRYRPSLIALERRLHALLKHPLINSKSFRRDLASNEAKSLSTVLRKVRSVPDRGDNHNDNDDDDQDPFFISLQRTSLNQVALRYKISEIHRELAADNSRASWSTRKPTIPTPRPDLEFNYRKTVLRSGRRFRTISHVREDVARNGGCTSPDVQPDALSLQELIWIDEGDGVPFSNLLPFLGKKDVENIKIIAWPDARRQGAYLVPPSLCYFPCLYNLSILTPSANLVKRLQRFAGSSGSTARIPQAAPTGHGPLATSVSNADEVFALATAMCEARVDTSNSDSRRSIERSSEPIAAHPPGRIRWRPPSLGVLCAMVVQDVLLCQQDDSETRRGKTSTLPPAAAPASSSAKWITQEAIEALPDPCQALIRHSYLCVSCLVPVSGYGYDHHNKSPRTRTSVSSSKTEALPPLREDRFLPGLRRERVNAFFKSVTIGGMGPWLMSRDAYTTPTPTTTTLSSGSTRTSSPSRPQAPTDTQTEPLRERSVDWRFCAPCACAHLRPADLRGSSRDPPGKLQADDGTARFCGCLLCNEERSRSGSSQPVVVAPPSARYPVYNFC
ncbi:unnamed protein product [Tilletia controversa]|uniref:Uncharacterized protein n=3 Tax=Tilletia TaxID=13289 RepID=A0A8X7MNH0_9BASI|nr:hypothetical protein CF328_g6033 [Tilletia controversa]KAE8191076.1 hypothetical protein CF336_g5026 [Tilletia laevis]KAE8253870.1 hypothetical protein A4X03_0g5795 [Tilletia caries]KAE8192616.1 hypothetical protein CF335_g5797 [Tilletia laevis]KAE8242353.1 hypothetical protein A4X06_0g6981 [Tilletia controversa]